MHIILILPALPVLPTPTPRCPTAHPNVPHPHPSAVGVCVCVCVWHGVLGCHTTMYTCIYIYIMTMTSADNCASAERSLCISAHHCHTRKIHN